MGRSGPYGENTAAIFRFLGKDRSGQLQFICSDMWQAYLKVIAKKASQAIHILDRFHIMQKMSKAIDKVRAAEVKQLLADGYEPILKGCRWLLLKRPENLSDYQAVKLKDLLQYNLKSVRSHLMKEDFQRFWTYTYPAWAGKFLDEWCTRAMRSRIEPMQALAKTLRKKRELLLNWFRADGALSSGVVEGFNNKLKLALPHNLLLERRVEGGVFKALPSRNGRGSKRIYAISASKNSRFVPSGF